MEELLSLPTPVLVALGALAAVQIGVEVWALVVLVRTPAERLVFGRKWPWVLIILLVNLVGAIVFLAAGRIQSAVRDPLAPEAGAAEAAGRAERAVEALYGSSSDGGGTR